jgi:hypothetical protein
MLKKYYRRAAAKEGEAKKDDGHGGVSGFPAVENVFLIFGGGGTVDMSKNQRKWERHKVLAAEKAHPSFIDLSEDTITFSREDHPNHIPNPGQYRWLSIQSSVTRGSPRC